MKRTKLQVLKPGEYKTIDEAGNVAIKYLEVNADGTISFGRPSGADRIRERLTIQKH